MKKVTVILFLAFLLSSSVVAAENAGVSQPANAPETAVGTVYSIGRVDVPTGATEGTIIIIDSEGNEARFTINPDTVVRDESANIIESGDISYGNKVSLTYSKTDMGNIAVTISKIKEI